MSVGFLIVDLRPSAGGAEGVGVDALVLDVDDPGVGQDISYFLTRCDRQRFDELTGFEDWANRKYDFRHSIRYADGVSRQRLLDGPASEDAVAVASRVHADEDGIPNYPDNCPANTNALALSWRPFRLL